MTKPDPGNRDADYPVVVVGSGSAGLFAALRAAEHGPVLLVTKSQLPESNSSWAQGGMAAAMDPADSTDSHLQDTLFAGAGLVDEAAARILCDEAPARVRDLQRLGVRFDSADGDIALGREAAHSANRIVHAGGDRTGAGITSALIDRVRENENITVLENALVTRLITESGVVSGVGVREGDGVREIRAGAVVLATGGAGQAFSHTTNPTVATGDGLLVAFEAGAELIDLEFFQFHPTAFRKPGFLPTLVSEAVRGDGAILRNTAGEAFMARYHELRELAPRDIVARAIVSEMQATGSDHVLLDCSSIGEAIHTRFPGLSQLCDWAEIDPTREGVPVSPAAHYFMGGIRTDEWGRTTLPGLYAAGECACTGVHGANRLASNSLIETVVFGGRVVEHIAGGQGGSAVRSPDAQTTGLAHRVAPDLPTAQSLAWRYAGIERDAAGLNTALAAMKGWGSVRDAGDREGFELRSVSLLVTLMVQAALQREESRGAHFRSDFPERDDSNWKRRQVFVRGD